MNKNVEKKVLDALQERIASKPIFSISMREIAETAGISHQLILYHYKNKNQIILSYVNYVKHFFLDLCISWFEDNRKFGDESNRDYFNRFLNYVSIVSRSKDIPNATIQVYLLGKYDEQISNMIKDVYVEWKKTMQSCLKNVLSSELDNNTVETMMIIITGIFLCNYNNVLSEEGNHDQLKGLYNLLLG